MFQLRTMNNKISRIHERALRLVYWSPFFDELLGKDRLFSIHHWDIQSLDHLGLSSTVMANIFNLKTTIPNNLRSHNEFYCRNPKTVKYGAETISDVAPSIWSLIPEIVKIRKSLDDFE